jgi:hypothetical protein
LFDFRKKVPEFEIWVLIFYTILVWNASQLKNISARNRYKCKGSPVTGLEGPREFQELKKLPRFLDNGTGWW